MKLVERWAPESKTTVSFEVFPARTPKAAGKLDETLQELMALGPDFFSVTFGAGGSTRDGSRELVEKLRVKHGSEVLAYFAGFGLAPDVVRQVLDAYAALGVDNVLAVRGDVPKDLGDFQPDPQAFQYASDLLGFMSSNYAFCLGAAGYPEGHVKAESKQKDLEFLKLKIERGAKFVIANYSYDNQFFFDFVARCRSAGITQPIIAGIMPIYSIKMTQMLASTCGATLTPEVLDAFKRLGEEDKDGIAAFGIDLATRQCRELIASKVQGLHFYTMDRSASVSAILSTLRSEGLLG